MPAPLNNDFGTKIKDPDLRQEAYAEYCKWLAKGNTKASFTFVKGSLMCTFKTLEKYIKDNPDEFPPVNIQVAYAQGMAYWEGVVNDTAIGDNQKASVPALNMLMRNKFKWDKESYESDNNKTEEAQNILVTIKKTD